METKQIKEELKEDEKLLVQVFRLEKLFNKYKKQIIAISILIVGYFLGNAIYDAYKNYELTKANEALNRLLKNPNDKEALNILKEDKKLYNLYLFYEGKLSKSNIPPLNELTAYKKAMQKGDIKALESYLLNPDYKLLKDDVRLALVKLYLQKGERKKAEDFASKIQNPDLIPFVKYLLHYGVAK